MFEAIERLVCDHCGARGPDVLESESAREVAEAEGWFCTEDEDLCPVCIAGSWEEKLREALIHLPGVETLATRNSDQLDFHDIGIGCLREALIAAYQAGCRHERAKTSAE